MKYHHILAPMETEQLKILLAENQNSLPRNRSTSKLFEKLKN